MYVLEKLGALTSARRLVHAWGTAYYEAAAEGRDTALGKVDGENIGAATVRWTTLVETARGNAAAFAAAANQYLAAQTALGHAARAAGDLRSYEAGIAVGRAQIRLEDAEQALRAASKPRSQ